MIISKPSYLAWLLITASAIGATANDNGGLPENHLGWSALSKFRHHLKCPYADEWLVKGATRAAIDLGLTANVTTFGRDLQQGVVAVATGGSCLFANVWSGQDDCLEFRGDAWTTETMQARCSSQADGARLVEGFACPLPTPLAGWCWLEQSGEGGLATQPIALPSAGPMASCDAIQGLCEGTMAGTWVAAGDCTDGGDSGVTNTTNGTLASAATGMPSLMTGGNATTTNYTGTEGGPPICLIAPGPMGAAHQAAYSMGYRPNCQGTPAESSPYMWPMAWTASIQQESVGFGSDDIVFTSRGKVHYRLDKNWKRSDTVFTEGIQRSIGQRECEPENVVPEQSNGPVLACNRTSAEHTTMIHRGSKMMWIDWNQNTTDFNNAANIASCKWLDLQVIGNVRPDWFMDDRGDSTDVQYLGNQHVYHDGKPRLVKQWRKKDFASMYFVMSVLANPGEDGIHWPMVLNVPGEGFGDDFLQKYSNHSLLTDDDDDLFLLDEALEAMGGTCENMASDGEGFSGPPVGETTKIPSNLEIDPNSWVHNVYTFSPVWEPPATDVAAGEQASSASSGMATTESGKVLVRSCYHEASRAVELQVEFLDVSANEEGELPWMALGYRPTEECLMIPRGGDTTDVILVAMDAGGTPVASKGSIGVELKSFSNDAIMSVYQTLKPLAETDGYSNVQVLLPDDTVPAVARSTSSNAPLTLHFRQSMENVPEAMHLMYAIGSSPQFGYHSSRECFEVTQFPTCSTEASPAMDENQSMAPESTSKLNGGATATSDASPLRLVSLPVALMILATL